MGTFVVLCINCDILIHRTERTDVSGLRAGFSCGTFNLGYPVEVVLHIMDHYCLLDHLSPLGFVNARSDLRAVPELNSLIESDTRFWSHLAITARTRVRDMHEHLLFMSPVNTIEVLLAFNAFDFWAEDNDGNVYAFPITQDVVADSVREVVHCIEAVSPSIRLWRDVRIYSEMFYFTRAVYEALAYSAAPRLRSLELIFPGHHNDPLFAVPAHIFSDSMANLRIISLRNASVPWGHPSYFSQIQVLAVYDIPRQGWPQVNQLVASFVCARNLAMLDFSGGGIVVENLDVSAVPRFVLPNLRNLTIVYWPECMPFLVLLSRGAFPALEELSLSNMKRRCWIPLLDLDFYRSLDRLLVTGFERDLSHVRTLLGRLDRVRLLDFRGADNAYFDTLFTDLELCPLLKRLYVTDADCSALVDYLRSRTAIHRRIQEVEYVHNHLVRLSSDRMSHLMQAYSFVDKFHLSYEVVCTMVSTDTSDPNDS